MDIAEHEVIVRSLGGPAADQTPTPSVKLLEAVMHFTAERNREALAMTLLRTMLQVLPAQAIEFHPCAAGDEGFRCRLERGGRESDAGTPTSARMHEDVQACLARLADAGSADAEGASLCLPDYSLHAMVDVHGVNGIIALEHLPGQCVDPKMVNAFLTIYHNFAAVIDDSRRDTLTGLLNRKTFESSIQTVLMESRDPARFIAPGAERRKCSAPGARHWLAVIDIDHFKRINDTFGHLYGDEVLLLLARLMMQSFRRSDRVFRFGGEEFAVLLSPCLPDDARKVLERFRCKTENYAFPQVGRVTISIGYVGVGLQDVPATVIGHADQALYASKREGRNRVTHYEDVAEQRAAEQSSSIDLF